MRAPLARLPAPAVPSLLALPRADPVVASDGTSYERTAIERVLNGNGLSPMTRERLQPGLWPNRALKRRIEEHEEDLLRAAAMVVAATGGRGEASGSAAPKKRRA